MLIALWNHRGQGVGKTQASIFITAHTSHPRHTIAFRLESTILFREQFVFKRHRWAINLVVAVSLLALTGLSLFPIFSSVLDSGAAVATEPGSLSAAQTTQIQAQAQGYLQVLKREPEKPSRTQGFA